jgi:formylglycine-generating enzyme required for sulfatase activity
MLLQFLTVLRLSEKGGSKTTCPVKADWIFPARRVTFCVGFEKGFEMRRFHLFHGRWTRLSVAAGALATVASMAAQSFAGVVTFGSGTNAFQMEFVTIGNPNNAADTTGTPNPAGAVAYEYGIGKFEVSEDMIDKYNASQPGGILQITKDTRSAAKPATKVSWNEAARFVNWLNTSTGNQAAYKFTSGGVNDDIELWTAGEAGYDVNNTYRNSLAKYVLPSHNEWYKAAYYNPTNSTYYDYANGSNTRPTAVTSGTTENTAVYNQSREANPNGPADVDQAGGLSPYGVMGLGGNVREFDESPFDLVAASSGSSSRGIRGGGWRNNSSDLSSSHRIFHDRKNEEFDVGFRVVSLSSSSPVPEPSSLVIGTLFGLGGLLAKRRMKR